MKSGSPLERILELDIPPMLKLLYEIEHLQGVLREGYKIRGVPADQCETVAEHSYSVAVYSYVLATEYAPQLDINKVIGLALVHDLPEVYAGDARPGDCSAGEKQAREREACHQLFDKIEGGQKYIDLWEEYAARQTPEARFVSQVDKFQRALRASIYHAEGYADMTGFITEAPNKIDDPELLGLLEKIISFSCEE